MPTTNTQEGQAGIYKVQHASGSQNMIVASGSTFDLQGGTINAAAGRITMPGSLAIGYMDLSAHLFTARQLASGETLASGSSAPSAFFGGLLMPDGVTPSLALLSTVDRISRLSWTSAQTAAIKLPPIAMPGDLATANGLTLQLYGESIGTGTASDAEAGFDIRCWADVGDTEMGATHPNFTSTPSYQGITLSSGDVTTGVLNVILVPSAHAGRAINLYGMRASYTKRTS